MSIIIALGVNTPETSYSDMAAGSDPESVEASPAVNENKHNQSCGSTQSHGYRGLPYADHNYGAPPPPTPPASPFSQTIIPRMDLNDVVRSSRYHGTAENNSADSDSSSEEDGTSWCHCSLTPDGLLIKCDNCRGLDQRKRKQDQHRKSENVSAGESSETESGDEEVSPATVSYTATQHTPTSIKLTVNRVKRSKSKKRKKSTEKGRGTPKGKKVKAFREGSRKSMRMKISTAEANILDENTAEGWESKIRLWTDQYEEAHANQYSADIQKLLQLPRATRNTALKTDNSTTTQLTTAPSLASVDSMDTINHSELSCNNTVLGSRMQVQLGRVTRVQKHRKILRAAKKLEPDTLIIEYRGKVMLKQQFEVNGHFFKKPYPFVLFYSKFNNVEMCIDARTFGNDARFVRRSCIPNAEVRHNIAEGMIHLCIYAIGQITKDAEVTIGFDYEFKSCHYKVDCACHKENQNCPVQKHNLSPTGNLVSSLLMLAPSPLMGAETRRRKARRRELEGTVDDDSNQTLDQQQEGTDLQGTSDTQEKLLDEVNEEEGENGAADENGVVHKKEEKRKRRGGGGGGEIKEDSGDAESGAGSSTVNTPLLHNTGVGVSTRRTTYVMEASLADEKSLVPNLPGPLAPPKPARSTKPRPKSRISRYRSNSSLRARRQRQALAQQAAVAAAAAAVLTSTCVDHSVALDEEGSQGPFSTEHVSGESGLGTDLLDGDGQGLNCMNRNSLRFPKTKKYLVTEWLNDKIPGGEKVHQEMPVERPLRITTDPTVLATTLNMLPGLSHSSLICTTPRHYVRFGSPFNPERRRPRPLQMDGTYGCYKKRWIKQVEDESCSASMEDGTDSTSSQQSNSSRSTPNPPSCDVNAPFKKRRSKYKTEFTQAPLDLLLRPLSPITPPLPEDSLHPLLHTQCGLLLPDGLNYSPLPSLSASRCNTPLQFENISSPEASPVHRPDSISPEPCNQTYYESSRPQFTDLSLPSSLESPVGMTSDDLSFPGAASGQDSLNSFSVATNVLNQLLPPSSPSLDSNPQNKEQAFRTEFNLIYTCSPLNANLNNPATSDHRQSVSERALSPAESFLNSVSGQGLLGDMGADSLSPYGEPLYRGCCADSGTPSHTSSHQPQRKKRANQHTNSLLTGKPDYQAIALRSEYKPVQNMVSLLEYRKRKQGSSRAKETIGSNSSQGNTPTQPHRSNYHHQMHTLPPPHGSFLHAASIPQMEDVIPSDLNGALLQSPHQEKKNQWMVPTTVERLREGQGVLERVLRSIKMEGIYNSNDCSTEKECDLNLFEMKATTRSPMKSSLSSSPALFAHQVKSTESHDQALSPSFLQETSSSPFRGPSGQGLHPCLSLQRQSQDCCGPSHPSHTHTILSDSRPLASSLHQPSGSSDGDRDDTCWHNLKESFQNSCSPTGLLTMGSRNHRKTKIESNLLTTQESQHQLSCGLKSSGQSQAGLQVSTRLLSTSRASHYPQRGTGHSQFQHSPLQGPGVRTQSGSF
ncbi:SET domain-containing protein 5 isoform X2 [Gouania willdenowi]|uniref:SET domain-containing protein 5 isoform X2 n=1 Tax=Gouania willdenowi TaxID=441366 RepID=UPI0010560C6D|nr:SET domain-containing protein 5 isoform X2 [Gouania willdenowi]